MRGRVSAFVVLCCAATSAYAQNAAVLSGPDAMAAALKAMGPTLANEREILHACIEFQAIRDGQDRKQRETAKADVTHATPRRIPPKSAAGVIRDTVNGLCHDTVQDDPPLFDPSSHEWVKANAEALKGAATK